MNQTKMCILVVTSRVAILLNFAVATARRLFAMAIAFAMESKMTAIFSIKTLENLTNKIWKMYLQHKHLLLMAFAVITIIGCGVKVDVKMPTPPSPQVAVSSTEKESPPQKRQLKTAICSRSFQSTRTLLQRPNSRTAP